jgi:S-adenosylmethionine-diacylgycerolhomoserine-N-methlytransferase
MALLSYSLSMIPDWRQALYAAAESITPDGSVRIVDFGDLKGLGRLAESSLRAWLRLFHVSPRSEIVSALAAAQISGDTIALRMLPGRYAFRLTLSKQGVGSVLPPVAR